MGTPAKNMNLSRLSQVTHYYFSNCAYKRPFLDVVESTKNKDMWFKPNDITKV